MPTELGSGVSVDFSIERVKSICIDLHACLKRLLYINLSTTKSNTDNAILLKFIDAIYHCIERTSTRVSDL